MSEQRLQHSLRLVATSSVIVLVGILLSKALTYLYRIIIAQHFGAEGWGLFTLALMVLSLSMMLASLGLPEGVLRYLSFYRGQAQWEKMRHLFHTSTALVAVVSIAGSVLLFLLSDEIALRVFHNERLIPFLHVVALALPFAVVSNLLLSVLLAFESVAWNSFLNNFFQNAVKVMALLVLIGVGSGMNAVMLSYGVGILALFLASVAVVRVSLRPLFRLSSLKRKRRQRVMRELFAYSWPIIFLGAVYTIFGWTDSFVIGYFMEVRDVGIYAAAFTLISLFGISQEVFKQLFFPLVVKEFSRKNNELVKQMSQQVGKWIFAINVPLFLLMMLFSENILGVLFGAEFLVASGVLRVLALGGLVSSLNTLLINLLSMQGKSKIILVNMASVGVFDLVANILLVPKYGLYGAAWSTTFSLALLAAILFIEVRAYSGIVPVRRAMMRIAWVTLVSAAAVLAVGEISGAETLLQLALLIALFVVLYSVLIALTGCLDKHDLATLRSFWQKVCGGRNGNR